MVAATMVTVAMVTIAMVTVTAVTVTMVTVAMVFNSNIDLFSTYPASPPHPLTTSWRLTSG